MNHTAITAAAIKSPFALDAVKILLGACLAGLVASTALSVAVLALA